MQLMLFRLLLYIDLFGWSHLQFLVYFSMQKALVVLVASRSKVLNY